MTLAARLRVVKRSQPVGNLLDFVKLRLVRGVRGIIHQPVGLAVKSCWGFRKGCGKREEIDSHSQNGNTKNDFHEHLEAGQGQGECNSHSRKNKVENGSRS